MTTSSIEEHYRVMALDYGERRIGVACSDELRILATGRGVVNNSSLMFKEILSLITSLNVRVVIVGLPTTLQGTQSASTKFAVNFADKLKALLPEGIELFQRDERFTSLMADHNLREGIKSRHKRKEKGLRDEESARILLQEYLDQHRTRVPWQ